MRTEIETRIRQDAATDATFRAALIADADTAIAERYGMDIPDGLNVRIVEEAADEVVLVLPVDRSDMQFSEADLDVVANAGAIYVPDKKTYADCM